MSFRPSSFVFANVSSKFGSRVFALSFLLGLSMASMTAYGAKEVKFKEYPFEIARGERLIVQGIRGNVRLLVSPPGKTPVVRARKLLADSPKSGASERFDALSFSVRREGGVVLIEPKGPSSRQEWIEWSRPGQPDLSFEIEAPSTPAEVYLHSGVVTSVGWKDQLAISIQDGRVVTTEGDGALRISILRGDIKVDKQKGAVEVESHASKVAVSNVEGDVTIHSFAGESNVSSVKGDVSLRSKAGAVGLSKINGSLSFDNGRGRIEGTAIEGAVRGTNDDGAVSLQLAGEADVSIETQEGTVGIKPPGGAGVLLKLSSEDGPIVAPDSVNVPKISGPKSVVARLDGAPKGVIVLRSKRGLIRVR